MFRRPFLLSALAVLTCLLLAVFGLAIMLVEPSNAAREDWAYKLGFPDGAKDIPLFDSCEAARFSHSGRDGEAPPATEITFRSNETASELNGFYRDYLGGLGCPADNLADTMCNARSYSIQIEEEGSCRAVKIFVVGDF
ncbi:hypothetical protein [Roseibium sediminis]|uniref:hypothetical protein n=1 Tax=Roseibium sediminis TaxID=1775174 RepID=UPI00123D5C5C|nr:hypothetical protein [Roseibium sediminis]